MNLNILTAISLPGEGGNSADLAPGADESQFSAVFAELLTTQVANPASNGKVNGEASLDTALTETHDNPLFTGDDLTLPALVGEDEHLSAELWQPLTETGIAAVNRPDDDSDDSLQPVAVQPDDPTLQALYAMLQPLPVATTSLPAVAHHGDSDDDAVAVDALQFSDTGEPLAAVQPNAARATETLVAPESKQASAMTTAPFTVAQQAEQEEATPHSFAKEGHKPLMMSGSSQAASLHAPVSDRPLTAQMSVNDSSSAALSSVGTPLSAGTSATTMTSALAATSPMLNASLGSPEWQQALNQQVLLFQRNGQQSAELRLHPEELGKLHITLNLDDNQAQLHIAAAHGQVRAAVEAAMPQLRQALAESGIQLGQSSVGGDPTPQWQQGQQNQQGQSHTASGEAGTRYAAHNADDTATHTTSAPEALQRMANNASGSVDIFA